jgi:A/G-specific adenine glycosylase
MHAAHKPIESLAKEKRLGHALVEWYEKNKRSLPWREDPAPYRVLVSEVMLQQTRVETVLGYFEPFLKRFPDILTLAAASDEALLKAWEGLGYYRRAFGLRRAAQVILQDYGGLIPKTPKCLQGLPGLGAYTGTAVAAIAYDYPCVALDANAIRVLARLFAFDGNVAMAQSLRRLTSLGQRLMPPKEASTFTQALMELGALVCTPKAPACENCPVAFACKGSILGIAGCLPVKPKTKPTPERRFLLGVAVWNGSLLLALRPPSGLLGGLWEFPQEEILGDQEAEASLVRPLWDRLNLRSLAAQSLGTVRHAYSHFRLAAHVYICSVNPLAGKAIPDAFRWVPLEELALHPLTGLTHKALKRAQPFLG